MYKPSSLLQRLQVRAERLKSSKRPHCWVPTRSCSYDGIHSISWPGINMNKTKLSRAKVLPSGKWHVQVLPDNHCRDRRKKNQSDNSTNNVLYRRDGELALTGESMTSLSLRRSSRAASQFCIRISAASLPQRALHANLSSLGVCRHSNNTDHIRTHSTIQICIQSMKLVAFRTLLFNN